MFCLHGGQPQPSLFSSVQNARELFLLTMNLQRKDGSLSYVIEHTSG